MDPEIRIVRIAEALGRYGSGALSCLEAAEVLGMSERHFRRLRDRYEAEGAAGLVDRRLGRASGRRAPLDQIEWVLEQYRTRYWDFTAKHWTLLTKVETSCDRILIAGGANVEAEWEQGPAV